MVNVQNRNELALFFNSLKEDAPARWGKMSPQHMIEHLANTMQMTNGKRLAALRVTEEEARIAKDIFIYTDVAMAQGLRSSAMGENPDPLRFPSLQEATVELEHQLDDFDAYFKNNPDAQFIHPRYNKLNYNEWIVFHNKHFTHHFKQFGLI